MVAGEQRAAGRPWSYVQLRDEDMPLFKTSTTNITIEDTS